MKKTNTEINPIEQYFEWWLEDMVRAKYIDSYKREPETLMVAPSLEYGRYKRFKSKEKEVEAFNIFPEINYTYDYIIYWNESAEYLFYEETNDLRIFQFGKPAFIAHRDRDDNVYSILDVKPTNSVQRQGGKVSSAITFPLKQRLLWDGQGIFVNKVVPIPMGGTGYNSALFIKTFTPQRYLLTDGGGSMRKIKYQVKTIGQYALEKSTYISNLLKHTK